MSQFIPPVEISDQTYNAIQRQAETVGTSLVLLIAASLERQFGASKSIMTDSERQDARQRCEQHFGELNLGQSTGADNDSIDRDLAEEYSNTHENL